MERQERGAVEEKGMGRWGIVINAHVVYIAPDEVILMRATSISRAIRRDGP